MGHLSKGKWVKHDLMVEKPSPKFFDKVVDSDDATYPAERGRYHLYYSYACPWAARALLVRSLLGLEDVISVSPVATEKHADGWCFDEQGEKSDPNNQFQFVHQLYSQSNSEFTGRVSVPILFDKKTKRIVNTESEDIMRMFNNVFSKYSNVGVDFYPEPMRPQIDKMNNLVFKVNLGVYKCGLAANQNQYDQHITILFQALDQLESILNNKVFLLGDQLTESDLRLYSTLVRFDCVYYPLFRTNAKSVENDYPNLSRFLKALNANPKIASTVNMKEIVNHYFNSDFNINRKIVSVLESKESTRNVVNKL